MDEHAEPGRGQGGPPTLGDPLARRQSVYDRHRGPADGRDILTGHVQARVRLHTAHAGQEQDSTFTLRLPTTPNPSHLPSPALRDDPPEPFTADQRLLPRTDPGALLQPQLIRPSADKHVPARNREAGYVMKLGIPSLRRSVLTATLLASALAFVPAALAATADTSPPTRPTNLLPCPPPSAPGTSVQGYASICWTSSTDDVGVAAYDIYRLTQTGFVRPPPRPARSAASPATTAAGTRCTWWPGTPRATPAPRPA